MSENNELLPAEMLGRILERLGLAGRPNPDLAGLGNIYAAWCREVPFDNIRKLIHLAESRPGPLAGDSVREFFDAWLAWGSGGTCWAGNGALCMLLASLGFRAMRGVATMLVAPDLPPNHGTVVVHLDGKRYLVDASMLFAEPLRLDDDAPTVVQHPAWGVQCSKSGSKWQVRWRALHIDDSMDCRIDDLNATAGEFSSRHEATRAWSPFNYALNVRRNVGNTVVGIAFGHRVVIDGAGTIARVPLSHDERQQMLVDELGIRADLAASVPADLPTPPPPMSQSANR